MSTHHSFLDFLSENLSPYHQEQNSSTSHVSFSQHTKEPLNTLTESDSESPLPYNQPSPELNHSQRDSSSLNIKETQTSIKHLRQGRWSPEEHNLFLEGLVLYSNEWKRVQEHIGTRSSTQSRSHAQKFFIRIRSKLSSIHNKKEIKEKIYQYFSKQLHNRTLIKDVNVFRDKMYELIFSHESALTSVNNQQHSSYQVKNNKYKKYIKKNNNVDVDTLKKRLGHNSNNNSNNDKNEIFTIYKDGLHKLKQCQYNNINSNSGHNNSITFSYSKESINNNNTFYKLYTLLNERTHIIDDNDNHMNIITTPNTKYDMSSSNSYLMTNQMNMFNSNNNNNNDDSIDVFEFKNHNSNESIYSYGNDNNNIDFLI